MSSITTIAIEKLVRLIGTPKCPAVIDVRTEEDFAADPRLIPGSVRRPHDSASEWAGRLRGPRGGRRLPAGAKAERRGGRLAAARGRARRGPGRRL